MEESGDPVLYHTKVCNCSKWFGLSFENFEIKSTGFFSLFQLKTGFAIPKDKMARKSYLRI